MQGSHPPLQPRPNVAALPPYPLADRPASDIWPIVNLASNESSVGPSEEVLAAVRSACGELNRYPEASAAALREAIGRHYGLNPQQIVCANGSSELILLIASAFLTPEDQALVSRTGYLLFATAARIAGAEIIRIDTRNLVFDVEAALRAVTQRTKILFLDNPNNPSGTTIDRSAVRTLRRGLREDILLVFDSAYAEYVTDVDYEAGDTLVDEFSNCIMLRTFSKAYGLAGLRIGWAYAPLETADLLHRIRQPNNLSAPAIAGALAAIDDSARVTRVRAETAATRDRFAHRLRALGVEVPASQGNFVLATFDSVLPIGAREIYERLKQKGIILRPMAPYGLQESLRITIGTPREMEQVAEAIEDLVSMPKRTAR